MSFEFQRGETNTVQLTVLRLSGTIPTFPADYDTPKIRILHVNGGGEIEDLTQTDMTQISSSNHWFHKFTIPTDAPFTKYLVEFETDIEGVTTQAAEEFKVVQPAALGSPGVGEHDVKVTLKNSSNNQPISNATVRVFDKAVPTTPVASAKTDSSGNATVFLDAGTYLIEFSKLGVLSETHDLIVNSDGSHDVVGD